MNTDDKLQAALNAIANSPAALSIDLSEWAALERAVRELREERDLLRSQTVAVVLDGKAIAIARNEWFASVDGQKCAHVDSLTGDKEKYLHNRLERAFLAGASLPQGALRFTIMPASTRYKKLPS